MISCQTRRGVGFVLLSVFLLLSCEDSTDRASATQIRYSGFTMGTSFKITADSVPDSVNSEEIIKQVDSRLVEINNQMSTYIEDSELSLFNSSSSVEWQPVSVSLYEVLKESRKISQLTAGAFDITIGPLVNLWGFGAGQNIVVAPQNNLIQQALDRMGYSKLNINESEPVIKKSTPDLYLDLSALAKGYAVDQVAGILETQGIGNYLVEIGGELKLKGRKENGELWRIAIEKPAVDQRMLHKVLPLSNISIATSGDYRNFFESDGVHYSHVIDPRTGRPVTHRLASVTILGHTTMQADAIATALMVLGPETGFQLAEQHDIAALFIIKDKDGFKEKSTSAFVKLTR